TNGGSVVMFPSVTTAPMFGCALSSTYQLAPETSPLNLPLMVSFVSGVVPSRAAITYLPAATVFVMTRVSPALTFPKGAVLNNALALLKVPPEVMPSDPDWSRRRSLAANEPPLGAEYLKFGLLYEPSFRSTKIHT